jgi:hypothetical protein
MADHDAAPAKEFMQSLFEEEAAHSFEEIAKLPLSELRAAMADPRPVLERAGLRPPKEVTLRMREAQPEDFGGLGEDVGGGPGGLDDGDGTGRLPPTIPGQRRPELRIRFCIDLCWGGIDKGKVTETPRRCVHICF